MNSIRDLHEEAMALAEMAAVARLRGDHAKVASLLQEALEQEAKAARLVPNDPNAEPTRSVLYRSAASLALDLSMLRDAERYIAEGLAGAPPEEVAEELRILFERVRFHRHLEVRNVSLAPNEIQMSLAGQAITNGTAPVREFITRIGKAETLLHRTVERMLGRPYREAGLASRRVRDYELYVSTPRAASFAVSLRVTRPQQPPLPQLTDDIGFVDAGEVIDEILTCLELFNSSAAEPLQQKIADPAYYRNFVGLAKIIAPDGIDVKLVGFTAIRDGQERRVALTEPRDDIHLARELPSEDQDEVEKELCSLTGTLLFADARDSADQKIRLVDDSGRSHTIGVPEGMMSDIVRPLWEERVTVTGYYRGRVLLLSDIGQARDT